MESLKRYWFTIPSTVRKPLVLVVGMLLVIISPFTGVLPGPGGIPIFLIGVAILGTEFAWAKRLQDWTLRQLHRAGQLWRQHKVMGTLIGVACAAVFLTVSFFAYRWIQTIV